MKILLPVDGSAFTKRALDFIARHGTLFGPSHTYMALTVVTQIPAHARRFFGTRRRRSVLPRGSRKGAGTRARVRKPTFTLDNDAPCHRSCCGMHRCIRQDAATGPHHMGSHGHSAIANLVLGSVAAGILARCGIPTLIVR
ncbi:universal stress protein [Paraburkholderia terrae]|uniref:Universal stress protein n=1 Tax=Paraburkholderia terrae TaxID=311230 RepID=A0A2I8F364_9BURK|nr:universal stress protein [Paraburkholderia terrae]